MSPLGKTLLNNVSTFGTFLSGISRVDKNQRFTKYFRVVGKFLPKQPPTSVRNTLSQAMILDHILNIQILNSDQIVRLVYAPCQLSNKVFTLPLSLQISSLKFLNSFLSIGRSFLFLRNSLMKLLNLLFRDFEEFRIRFFLTIRVCIEGFQTYVQTNHRASKGSALCLINVDNELDIVTPRPLDDPNALNFLFGVLVERDRPDQLECTNPLFITESNIPVINRYFPTISLILDRTTIMLKPWLVVLTYFSIFTISIELRDCSPSPLTCRYSSCRIESANKGELGGQILRQTTQVILIGTPVVHPILDGFIPNELSSLDSLINRMILGYFSTKFKLYSYSHTYIIPYFLSLKSHTVSFYSKVAAPSFYSEGRKSLYIARDTQATQRSLILCIRLLSTAHLRE